MGMQISASGMFQAQQRMNITAGNIANATTPGYQAVQRDGTINTSPGVPEGSNVNLVTEEVGLLVERADFRANAAALKVQNGLAGEVLDLLA